MMALSRLKKKNQLISYQVSNAQSTPTYILSLKATGKFYLFVGYSHAVRCSNLVLGNDERHHGPQGTGQH
jgi:hypothetical protein